MRYLWVLLLLLGTWSCKTKPFLKVSLKSEKLRDDCKGMDMAFRMNSNLNGERYEFQRCLDADFSKEKFEALREGDTVVLKFKRTGSRQALFDITIDIDSYPRYNFLTIDGETFPIIPVGS
ncbi:MAG: hypothetical protein GC171_02545 [Terrimonas sp.]|nr:hypothetical protein [Terrimonas sp.]